MGETPSAKSAPPQHDGPADWWEIVWVSGHWVGVARWKPPSYPEHEEMRMTAPWTYPGERYYYPWWGQLPPAQPTDGDIKSVVVDRLRDNPRTKDDDIKVDVKQGVVILGGEVSSWLAKRAAGDDSWDTPGVVDVSNQLVPRPTGR